MQASDLAGSYPKRVAVIIGMAIAVLMIAFVLVRRSNFGGTDLSVGHNELVRSIVDSEELILQLTPRLKQLSTSAKNLLIPDPLAQHLFAEQVQFTGLANSRNQKATSLSTVVGIHKYEWPAATTSATISRGQLDIWRRLLDRIQFFQEAKFYLVDGKFAETDSDVFVTTMGFKGLAFTRQESWLGISARQQVRWRRSNTDDADWQIVGWKTNGMTLKENSERLFEETLDAALPRRLDLLQSRTSLHHEEVVSAVQTGRTRQPNERYRQYFEITANAQHPALSVVDIDMDGWDDLYVMVRLGTNLLLRNEGDGTFIECARQYGLDLKGMSTGGIFADFDNDGDPDLMLGRSLERSQLFLNDAGRFTDVSRSHVDVPLPYLVTSVSSADYNGDGLLDIYLCTYGKPQGTAGEVRQLAEDFLDEDDAAALVSRHNDPDSDHNLFLNAAGPPNRLLVNRGGGRFELAPENEQVQLWLNSFQATWSDFDDDGDPDLYVANDYAPDALLRNDNRTFVDITEAAGGETMLGFGMGATWGDYDNDGRQDLYVSNMFSKAGLRITGQLPDLDRRFRRSADGNRLYRNVGDTFELVSGYPNGIQPVASAGWSWGGQFADFDNDGNLDIYVTSGYRTAPEEIADNGDL